MMGQLNDDKMGITNRINKLLPAFPCNLRYFLIDLKSTVRKDNYLKILILLTITGLILRLWRIGDISLWVDKTLTN
jgi:hypothetical protein